jgi:hypothetical protein
LYHLPNARRTTGAKKLAQEKYEIRGTLEDNAWNFKAHIQILGSSQEYF